MLAEINQYETDRAVNAVRKIASSLPGLATRASASDSSFTNALRSLESSIRETRKYWLHRRSGGERDGSTEDKLSHLWANTAFNLMPIDGELSRLCMIKGHGWADPKIWEDPKYRDLPIQIEDMFARLLSLLNINQDKSMKDFFVSYNSNDVQWAEWIAWTLEEAGYSAVIQAWDFRPGSNFVLEMQKASSEAEHTIAVLSPNFLGSQYTASEWAAAFAGDPTGQKHKLIPVRVAKCELSGLLAQIIYIDLVGLTEPDARAALLGGLSTRNKPTAAPRFPGDSAKPEEQPEGRVVPERVNYPGSELTNNISGNVSQIVQIGTVHGSVNLSDPAPVSTSAPPSNSHPKQITTSERLSLIQKLNALPAQQFNMIIFALNPPPGLIPPMPAPQGDRTHALLEWAQGPSGCGLHEVQEILNTLLDPH